MAGVAEAQLDVLIDIKEAVQSLQTLEKEAKSAESGISKSLGALKAAAGALAAVFAAKEIVGFFADGIDAAEAQEKALASLSQQLKLSGDFSKAAVGDFTDFANAMEASTTFADDVVISQLAVAKSFGVSNEQAKDLVKAASELSAVTGDSLDSSVQQLGKTLSGTTGRLGKTVDGFDNLTEAELKAGKGFEYILQRLGGSQAAVLETFSGQLKQVKNSFGNLEEAFGDAIVSNPVVVASFSALKDILNFLVKTVEDNKDALKDLVSGGLKIFVATLSGAVEGISILAESFQALTAQLLEGVGNLADLTGGILSFIPGAEGAAKSMADFGDEARNASKTANDKLGSLSQSFNAFQAVVDAGAQKIFTADQKVQISSEETIQARKRLAEGERLSAKEREAALKELAAFEAKLRQDSASDIEKAIQVNAEAAKKIAEFEKLGVLNKQKADELRLVAETNLIGKLEKLRADADEKALEQAKKDAEEQRKVIEGIAENPLKVVISQFQIDPVASKDLQAGIAGVAGGAGLLLGGKEGAKKAISGLAGAAADAFVPGLGSAVGPLVQALSDGPEATKAMVKGFIEGVPDIINAIAESIPVLVETLVDVLINKGGLIKIAIALGKAMLGVEIFKALGKQIFGGVDFNAFGDKMGTGLTKGIVDGARRLFEFDQKVRETLLNAARALFAGIVQGAQKLFDFDKTIRVAMLDAAQGLFNGIRNALSPPPWLADFFKQVQSIFTTPAWIADIRAIFKNLIDNFFGLFGSFTKNFYSLFDFFVKAVTDLFNFLPDAIASIFGGGGGGSGGLGVKGSIAGQNYSFATGLTEVPAGYPNDSFAAMLTSGERIVDPNTNGDLKAMLADYNSGKGGGAGSLKMEALLVAILQCLQQPSETKTEIKIDNAKFADLVLKQQRRGARLSA